jgi:hypothetical protein
MRTGQPSMHVPHIINRPIDDVAGFPRFGRTLLRLRALPTPYLLILCRRSPVLILCEQRTRKHVHSDEIERQRRINRNKWLVRSAENRGKWKKEGIKKKGKRKEETKQGLDGQ